MRAGRYTQCALAPLLVLVLLCVKPARAEQAAIAVTIDDLPVTSAYLRTEGQLEAIIYRLLAKIRRERAPVTGFVNEGNVYVTPNTVVRRADWLQMWSETTRSLGNHTYSHMDLEQQSLQAFEDDIAKGELITARLMSELGVREKYFRHPYLHMGKTVREKREVDAFLGSRGYRIAPVTIDPEDSSFASVYDIAELDGDQAAMERIGMAYLNHLGAVAAAARALSKAIFKRPIREILLIHENALNARYYGEVLALLRRADFRLVTLAEALEDPAYATPDDTYTPGNPWEMQRMWACALAPQVRMPDVGPPAFVFDKMDANK